VKTLFLAALASLAACTHHASPDDVFRAFTLAVLSHQPDAAWGMLSKDSQEAMAAETKAAAAASPKGEVPDDPKAFLFGEDVGLARPIQEIRTIDEANGVAHLSVTTSEGKHTVKMVLEEGHWKLDLTEGLKL
jgi:hypothetical protein